MNARRAVPLLVLGAGAVLFAVLRWGLSGGPPAGAPPSAPHPAGGAGGPPAASAGGGAPRMADRRGEASPAVLAIAGSVVDGAGAPVAGADVVVLLPAAEASAATGPAPSPPEVHVEPEVLRDLFGLTGAEAASLSWNSGVPAPPEGPAASREAGRARSGADGTFSVRVESPGPFRVEASGGDLGFAAADGVGAGGEPLVLRLRAGSALSGRVVQDASNAPFEGAVVVARSGGSSATATSAADGTFTLPRLPPGRWRVCAGAPGYAMAVLDAVEVPSNRPVEVRLGTGWILDAKVWSWDIAALHRRTRGAPRGESREPLEGALVVLLHRASSSFRAGVTGPEGTVRVDRLGPGTWEVAAHREGYGVGITRALRLGTGVPPEESREIRLVPLVPTSVVVRGADGTPMAGVAVYTGGESDEFDRGRSRLIGRTDAAGRIRVTFDDAVPSKSVAWVVPEGGGAATKVEAGEPGEEVKVSVHPGRTVEGVVKDSRGRILPGARVTLLVEKDEREMGLELRSTTDDAGAFRFPEVPFGAVTIEVEAAGGDDFGQLEVEEGNREDPLAREVVVEGFGAEVR